MKILMLVKYVPDENTEYKGDLINTSIRGMCALGHQVTVATNGHSATKFVSSAKVFRLNYPIFNRLIRLLFPNRFKKIRDYIYAYFLSQKLVKLDRDIRFDAVICEATGILPVLIAHHFQRRTKLPLLIREHRSYANRVQTTNDFSRFELAALQHASKLVAVSPGAAKFIQALSIRNGDIEWIPNALSSGFFENSLPSPDILEWKGDQVLFGAWTRWRGIKRLDLLLETFKLLVQSGTPAKLVVAGDIVGMQRKKWAKNFIAKHGLERHVRLLGSVDRTQIHELANTVDYCMISSDFETFALPALEAMAAGKPVISTRCIGPEFLIQDGVNGYLAEKGSAADLCLSMQKALTTNFQHKQIRAQVAAKFSEKEVSKQMEHSIREIVSEHN